MSGMDDEDTNLETAEQNSTCTDSDERADLMLREADEDGMIEPGAGTAITTEEGALNGTVMAPRESELGIVEHLVAGFDDTYGPTVIFTEGAFFRWRGTHWARATEREAMGWVKPYDGIPWGQTTLKLTVAKMRSILALLAIELDSPGFFDVRPLGINARNGFVDLSGEVPRLVPHHPAQAQDFVLAGAWSPDRPDAALLETLVRGCFQDDKDGGRKALSLMELAGAVATGIGTTLREPVAFVFVGAGANGKSQLLEVLRGLVPPRPCPRSR